MIEPGAFNTGALGNISRFSSELYSTLSQEVQQEYGKDYLESGCLTFLFLIKNIKFLFHHNFTISTFNYLPVRLSSL